jgi:glucose/sorbosone dehydrogenase
MHWSRTSALPPATPARLPTSRASARRCSNGASSRPSENPGVRGCLGIHFYAGTRYPRWRNDLFVTGLGGTALRRLEVKGRQVLHREVVFDRYGRVRDIVTGPDGLLYVALQLPGPQLFASTPGLVVRLAPVE